MSKQSAVEWLVEQIKSDQNQKALSATEWMQIIEQAKQMEREQRIDDYNVGYADATCRYPNSAFEYVDGKK